MRFCTWLLACLFALGPGPAGAEEAKKPIMGDQDRVSTEEMYARWSQHTPQEVIAHARKAVAFLQKNGKAGFPEFNDPKSDTWWPGRPYFTPVMVMRCDELRNVTHPIPEFYPQMTQKGVVKKFIDTRGEHTFFYLCAKLKGRPQGTWVKQLHFWPGTRDAVWMAVLGMPVPDTPYQVHVFYITPNPDIDALDALLLSPK